MSNCRACIALFMSKIGLARSCPWIRVFRLVCIKDNYYLYSIVTLSKEGEEVKQEHEP